MGEIGSYIEEKRRESIPTLLTEGLIFLGVTVAAVFLSFFFFKYTGGEWRFHLLKPTDSDTVLSHIFSAVFALTPVSVMLALLYLSGYTTFSRTVGVLTSAWRGLCLGCITSFYRAELITGLDSFTWTAVLYLMSTLCIIALSAVTVLYSGVICVTSAASDTLHKRDLSREYTKLFFAFSGVIFIIEYLILII